MVLDAQGHVSGTIHVRDVIAKKRGGRRIPMHPDLRRALERLARTTEPIGPVIRSYRGAHLKANSIVNWFVALQGARLRRLLVAFRTAQLHHHRRPQHPSLRLQLARRPAARRASVDRDDGTLYRRRHLRAEAIGCVPLGTPEIGVRRIAHRISLSSGTRYRYKADAPESGRR
jgi:hypothetical protein